MTDQLAFCPFCSADAVERHYARVDGGSQPGCTACERTLPMDEWAAAVLAA